MKLKAIAITETLRLITFGGSSEISQDLRHCEVIAVLLDNLNAQNSVVLWYLLIESFCPEKRTTLYAIRLAVILIWQFDDYGFDCQI